MRPILLTLSCLMIATGLTARADTIFVSISPATLIGNPGDTLQFFGSLTNNTASTVFINGDSFSFTAGSLDDSPFLSGPVSLGPNEVSTSFEMFDVTLPLGITPSIYDGTFNVEGGADGDADGLLGTGTFHVEVDSATVPEPSAGWLVLLGATVLLWRRGWSTRHLRAESRGSVSSHYRHLMR